MTAKEYLSQYKYLDVEIRLKEEQKKRLEELAEFTSFVNNPRGTGISDKVGRGAGNIVDMQDEIDAMKGRLLLLKAEIERGINEVENPNYRLILTMRYINNYTFEQIAEKTNYSYRQVMRNHKRALDNFECVT